MDLSFHWDYARTTANKIADLNGMTTPSNTEHWMRQVEHSETDTARRTGVLRDMVKETSPSRETFTNTSRNPHPNSQSMGRTMGYLGSRLPGEPLEPPFPLLLDSPAAQPSMFLQEDGPTRQGPSGSKSIAGRLPFRQQAPVLGTRRTGAPLPVPKLTTERWKPDFFGLEPGLPLAGWYLLPADTSFGKHRNYQFHRHWATTWSYLRR